MSAKPKVSVIMSEYNTNEVFLHSSIKSILEQTFSDFEFIIVDDRGKINLEKIVDRFNDKRIRIIKNSKNMGLTYSLNRAIQSARAEYVVRMDTDDIALPDRVQTIYTFISTHPEYDVVGSRALEFSGNEQYGELGAMGEKNKKSVMRGDVPIHPSVIIRKSAIEKVNYYKDYTRAEDLALWCELLLRGSRIFVINDVLLLYRVNASDYKKRKIQYRRGEINARFTYYPKMGATPFDYVYIVKSVISGILPTIVVERYRHSIVLKRSNLKVMNSTEVKV